MSDGRRWRGGSGAREEGEALWKPEMSAGVAVLHAREKKMGSLGLRENPETEGDGCCERSGMEGKIRDDDGVLCEGDGDDGFSVEICSLRA